uniref:Uncharacterized protein n=1 Tax=Trichogramma kaykai TaxID=54128 RepID=A0ABD2VXB0_9HYME
MYNTPTRCATTRRLLSLRGKETSKCNDPRAIRVAIDDEKKKRTKRGVREREREREREKKRNIIITLARASDSDFSAGYVNLMGRSSPACLR